MGKFFPNIEKEYEEIDTKHEALVAKVENLQESLLVDVLVTNLKVEAQLRQNSVYLRYLLAIIVIAVIVFKKW